MSTSFKPNNKKKLNTDFAIAKKIDARHRSLYGSNLKNRILRVSILRHKYILFLIFNSLPWNLPVRMKTFYGKSVVLPLGDVDTRFWYYYGLLTRLELGLISFCINEISDNEVVFDIGANYGFYTLITNELALNGSIHAFEPNRDVYKFLSINLGKEKRVTLNNFAVSDHNGVIDFYSAFNAKASGLSTTFPIVASGRHSGFTKTSVECKTLDEYVKLKKVVPTFIKVDVEGAELSVFQGAENLLRNHKPVIAMEVWKGESGVHDPSEAVSFLYDLNYKSYMINDDGSLVQENIDLKNLQVGFKNYLFKKG